MNYKGGLVYLYRWNKWRRPENRLAKTLVTIKTTTKIRSIAKKKKKCLEITIICKMNTGIGHNLERQNLENSESLTVKSSMI